MVSTLDSFVEREISILTTEGRHYVGVLKGFDQAVNLVIDNSRLIVWHGDFPREEIETQSLIVRGDTIICVGLKDSAIEFPVSGQPAPSF